MSSTIAGWLVGIIASFLAIVFGFEAFRLRKENNDHRKTTLDLAKDAVAMRIKQKALEIDKVELDEIRKAQRKRLEDLNDRVAATDLAEYLAHRNATAKLRASEPGPGTAAASVAGGATGGNADD